MKTLLFLFLYTTRIRAEIDRRDFGFGNEFKEINRGRMHSHTVLMFLEDLFLEECIHYCISYLSCRTVSYSSTAKLCELNDMDFDETEADTEATGWSNYGTPTKVDGGYSNWKTETGCSRTCEGGHVTYFRTCDNPTPKHGGSGCYGDEIKTETCNTHQCPPVDLCSSSPCNAGATCDNTPGSYKCTCKSGYIGDGLTCTEYKCTMENMSWDNANNACKAFGGDLASILNEAEKDLIVKACTIVPSPFRVWIGLNDKEQERLWLWTDGTTATYLPWGGSQPNDRNHRCVSIDVGQDDQKMYDQSCKELKPFVCKKVHV